MYNFPQMYRKNVLSTTSRWAMYMLAFAWLTSCYSRQQLIYLQDSGFSSEYPTQIKNRRPEYRIQENDVLHVDIQNPDTETAQYFNYGNNENNNFGAESVLFINGYSVDEEGFITIPLVGNVKVVGLTVDEAKKILQQEVNKFLRNTTVNVKLISFKISVMGEVNNPGYYYIYNGQATVLEGLSLAGDLTDFGNRNSIKLIRQTDDGAEVILLDLTSSELMNSKYYYLLPNDVIYVEPSKPQITRANLQPVGIIFSGITALGVIVTAAINIINLQNTD